MLRTGFIWWAARNKTVGTLFGASFFGDEPSPAVIQVFLDTYLARDHGPVAPLLGVFGAEDRYGRLPEITVPTVVVCGRSDTTTPTRHADRLATGIPGARAVWIEGKGHMLNWEDPEVLIDAVTSLAPTPSVIHDRA